MYRACKTRLNCKQTNAAHVYSSTFENEEEDNKHVDKEPGETEGKPGGVNIVG